MDILDSYTVTLQPVCGDRNTAVQWQSWHVLDDVLPDAIVTEHGCPFLIYMISQKEIWISSSWASSLSAFHVLHGSVHA